MFDYYQPVNNTFQNSPYKNMMQKISDRVLKNQRKQEQMRKVLFSLEFPQKRNLISTMRRDDQRLSKSIDIRRFRQKTAHHSQPQYSNYIDREMLNVGEKLTHNQRFMSTNYESGVGKLIVNHNPPEINILERKNIKFGCDHQKAPCPQLKQKQFKHMKQGKIVIRTQKGNKERLEAYLFDKKLRDYGNKFKHPVMKKIESNLIKQKVEKDHMADYLQRLMESPIEKRRIFSWGRNLLNKKFKSYCLKTELLYKNWDRQKRHERDTHHTDIFTPPDHYKQYRPFYNSMQQNKTRYQTEFTKPLLNQGKSYAHLRSSQETQRLTLDQFGYLKGFLRQKQFFKGQKPRRQIAYTTNKEGRAFQKSLRISFPKIK